MRGKDVRYDADATVTNLDLQRVGQALKAPALAEDRFKSVLNGHVTVNGHGAALKEMEIRATGTLADSSLLGGHVPQLAFDASMANDVAHVTADGTFAGFDPAALSGKLRPRAPRRGHSMRTRRFPACRMESPPTTSRRP